MDSRKIFFFAATIAIVFENADACKYLFFSLFNEIFTIFKLVYNKQNLWYRFM